MNTETIKAMIALEAMIARVRQIPVSTETDKAHMLTSETHWAEMKSWVAGGNSLPPETIELIRNYVAMVNQAIDTEEQEKQPLPLPG